MRNRTQLIFYLWVVSFEFSVFRPEATVQPYYFSFFFRLQIFACSFIIFFFWFSSAFRSSKQGSMGISWSSNRRRNNYLQNRPPPPPPPPPQLLSSSYYYPSEPSSLPPAPPLPPPPPPNPQLLPPHNYAFTSNPPYPPPPYPPHNLYPAHPPPIHSSPYYYSAPYNYGNYGNPMMGRSNYQPCYANHSNYWTQIRPPVAAPLLQQQPLLHPPPYVEHQNAKKVRNDVNVHKNTLRLEVDERNPDHFLVSFTFDALFDGR